MDWTFVKEVFFTIGSIAGVIALARPILDQKYQRDLERIRYIKELIDEQVLIDLDDQLYQSRHVPSSTFHAFDRLFHQLDINHDLVKFSGPGQTLLREPLEDMRSCYRSLRELVQVDMWEPAAGDDNVMYWRFNRDAFSDEPHANDYVEHLDACGERAVSLRLAYQRFLINSELHLYEIPFAKWILPRRYSKYGV